MTLASIARGVIFPTTEMTAGLTNVGTVDAAGEKFAMLGRLYIDGRAASKTLSTGTIQFRTGACTFANAGTTLDIGIQGVLTGTGPPATPDGTFTVKTTLTGGAGITTAAWNTATMNSGTATLSHGDLIAVVFDMTARAGVDSVLIASATARNSSHGVGLPNTNAFVAAAWQTGITIGAMRLPNVIIVFDDGTLGWIDHTIPVSVAVTTESGFATGTNPNERGMIFQVPWACKIDALWATIGIVSATSDFTLKLYSDPTGTPTLVTSLAILAEQLGLTTGSNAQTLVMEALPSEVSLSANTDYMISVLATGAGNVNLSAATLGNTAHRATIPGGTTLKKATRNGSAGVFTAENPAVTMYEIGVRISQFHDGASSGGGISRARAASGF